MPPPPDYLLVDAAAEWQRIAPELVRLNLLTPLDLHTFGLYYEAFGRWVQAVRLLAESGGKLTVRGARGNVVPSPVVRIVAAAASDMLRFAGEFGLTPVARSRLAAGLGGQPPGPGKFGDLLGG